MEPDTHTQDTIEICRVVLSAPTFLRMWEDVYEVLRHREAYPDYNWSYREL